MSLVEQERLGMHLRKIVAVPSGDLQYEQEVSKWDSTRNAKQLHLRTDRANCSCLKCEELCKERVASNSIPQETFPWLAFLNPRFPLCRRPGSLCSACWLGEQCRHMCTWARQKLGSHPLLLSLPHSPYQMHHQVLLIAPPKYFSKQVVFPPSLLPPLWSQPPLCLSWPNAAVLSPVCFPGSSFQSILHTTATDIFLTHRSANATPVLKAFCGSPLLSE